MAHISFLHFGSCPHQGIENFLSGMYVRFLLLNVIIHSSWIYHPQVSFKKELYHQLVHWSSCRVSFAQSTTSAIPSRRNLKVASTRISTWLASNLCFGRITLSCSFLVCSTYFRSLRSYLNKLAIRAVTDGLIELRRLLRKRILGNTQIYLRC